MEFDQTNGFDKRIVLYEEIHKVNQKDFDVLLNAMDISKCESILDSGCGYGAITLGALKKPNGIRVKYSLADISNVQLDRARKEIAKATEQLQPKPEINFFFDNIVFTEFAQNSFDAIGAKMVFHEIKQKYQQKAVAEWNKILKPGGRLVTWDLSLAKWNQELIQDIVREKDRLAGFEFMVENRYFLREDEILSMLKQAGFKTFKKIHDITYHINTSKRLQSEFGGDLKKVQTWNEFIRKRISGIDEKILNRLSYQDHGDFISMQLPKSIFLATK